MYTSRWSSWLCSTRACGRSRSPEDVEDWRLQHGAVRPWKITSVLWSDDVLEHWCEKHPRKWCTQLTHRRRVSRSLVCRGCSGCNPKPDNDTCTAETCNVHWTRCVARCAGSCEHSLMCHHIQASLAKTNVILGNGTCKRRQVASSVASSGCWRWRWLQLLARQLSVCASTISSGSLSAVSSSVCHGRAGKHAHRIASLETNSVTEGTARMDASPDCSGADLGQKTRPPRRKVSPQG